MCVVIKCIIFGGFSIQKHADFAGILPFSKYLKTKIFNLFYLFNGHYVFTKSIFLSILKFIANFI